MLCNSQGFAVTSFICLLLGIGFHVMFNSNIPDSYDPNPFIYENNTDKFGYFNNNKSNDKDCNEKKEEIMKENKSLYEIFPINTEAIIIMAKMIQWITIIPDIDMFLIMIFKDYRLLLNKIQFSIELIVGLILTLLWLIIMIKARMPINRYDDFLDCENVNKKGFQKYNVGAANSASTSVIFYLFFLGLYFAIIILRNYTLRHASEYELI